MAEGGEGGAAPFQIFVKSISGKSRYERIKFLFLCFLKVFCAEQLMYFQRIRFKV